MDLNEVTSQPTAQALEDWRQCRYTLSFNVYPNPNNGQFEVEILALPKSNFTCSIYDNIGRLLYQKAIIPSAKFNIDLLGKVPGIYTIVINTNQDICSHRIIIQ